MSRVDFRELPPKYQKGKKRSIIDMDDDELEEYGENKDFKKNYDKQFNENRNYFPQQNKAINQEMSPEDWNKLDNPSGPTTRYKHPLDLQNGSEIEANLNSFSNRGYEIPSSKNKTKLGIWGGLTLKKRSKKQKTMSLKRKTKSLKRKIKTNKRKIKTRRK